VFTHFTRNLMAFLVFASGIKVTCIGHGIDFAHKPGYNYIPFIQNLKKGSGTLGSLIVKYKESSTISKSTKEDLKEMIVSGSVMSCPLESNSEIFVDEDIYGQNNASNRTNENSVFGEKHIGTNEQTKDNNNAFTAVSGDSGSKSTVEGEIAMGERVDEEISQKTPELEDKTILSDNSIINNLEKFVGALANNNAQNFNISDSEISNSGSSKTYGSSDTESVSSGNTTSNNSSSDSSSVEEAVQDISAELNSDSTITPASTFIIAGNTSLSANTSTGSEGANLNTVIENDLSGTSPVEETPTTTTNNSTTTQQDTTPAADTSTVAAASASSDTITAPTSTTETVTVSENGLESFINPGNEITNADYVIQSGTTGEYSGYKVANAGDLDGDGKDDLIIGAPHNNKSGENAGAVYVVLGKNIFSSNINLANADWILTGEKAGDYLGAAVAGAGDVNGDGKDDILIGAYGNDDNGVDSGKTYLIYGETLTSLPETCSITSADCSFTGENAGDYCGYAVAGAGDVNSDGKADILIGAYRNDAGKTYLVMGDKIAYRSSISLSFIASYGYVLTGENIGDQSGFSVASAGDVNKDGRSDILIGAVGCTTGGHVVGKAYLVLSTSLKTEYSMNLSAADYSFVGESDNSYTGFSLAAGDIDADGTQDIVVGAPYDSSNGYYAGKVYIVYGKDIATFSESNSLSNAGCNLTGENAYDNVGYSLSMGDVDSDKKSDILIGTIGSSYGSNPNGKAYLTMGRTLKLLSGTNDLSISDYLLTGKEAVNNGGLSVSIDGDFNGDGYNDVLIGSYAENSNNGNTYLVNGAPYSLLKNYRAEKGTENWTVVGTASTATEDNGNNCFVIPANSDYFRQDISINSAWKKLYLKATAKCDDPTASAGYPLIKCYFVSSTGVVTRATLTPTKSATWSSKDKTIDIPTDTVTLMLVLGTQNDKTGTVVNKAYIDDVILQPVE